MKHALRSLAKSPGFSFIAVLTLALGIGLSASSFSMANAFLLRNVPYPEPHQLVRVFGTTRQSQTRGFSPGAALHVRAHATTLVGVALYNGEPFTLGEPGQPAELITGMSVSADFFKLMGVQPFLGRGFVDDDDEPDRPLVAVITHRAWVRRYAADPAVIGRNVRLNTHSHTIVGVLPPAFDAPLVWGPVEFVVPRVIAPAFHTNFRDSWMQAVGRLKPGVSLRQAQSELSTLAAQLEQEHPREIAGVGLRVVGLAQSNMDNVSKSLLWLMTAISLTMLLIACANLASLHVARAFGRNREFAIRAALGAGRRQLMLPLALESLVLAAVGGLAGLLIAGWSNAIIGRFLFVANEPGYKIPFDGRVFAFAVFASLLSGLAFGLAPAWLASRSPAADALKDGSRGATSGRGHQRLKNSLIVVELALALALVGIAASFGLGARSFLERQVGWNMEDLFRGFLALPYNQYSDDTRNRTFQRELLDRLSRIPGVQHAVLCTNLPLFSLGGALPLAVEGLPAEERGREPIAEAASVTSDYFSALHIPLKAGRIFPATLTETDPAVAVVNEAFARRFWPGQNAIGRRIRLGDSETWTEIVGIVGDVQMLARFDAPETPLQLYRPLVQAPSRYLSIVLRSRLPAETLTQTVRDAVASLDSDLPVANPGSVRAAFERNLSNLNLVIVNLGISAGMGLLIAAVGLFGVISQLTHQRTRDIGVRMALGAQTRDISRMIVGQGMKLLLIGIVIGLPAFYALTTVLRRAMPEMELPGLWLLAANLVVLSLTMLAACYLPARRAARINPVDALRSD